MPKGPPTLFHPKKKPRSTTHSGVNGLPRSQESPGPSSTRSNGQDSDDDDTLDLPQGSFSEFKLMSCPRNGWKYDVMKFDSRNKVIDISTWAPPIKLNRKELRRPEEKVEAVGIKPMVGLDGKPVIDQFGNPVMVDKDGMPVHVNADGSTKGKDKDKEPPKKGFRGKPKKIKQVFLTDEATRLMRKEERYPWVMEDATGKEVWTASMEETSKADVYAFFMPAANNIFNFVPAHRWYKFHKKPSYYVPTLEEAEKVLDKIRKNKDPQTWLLRNKGNASGATLATLKSEDSTPGPSLGPGGRRLRAVDSGVSDLFGDDEDDKEAMKRRAREMGGEGHVDEMEYEEDFADDEETMEVDEKLDEEAKELEERMKREYKNANKQRDEGYVDNSDDEDDDSKLTKEGKRMKKLIQNVEKNDAYDSDQEENPYASSAEEEEDEDDLPAAPVDPATKPGASQPNPAVKQEPSQTSTSRANSPTSPSLGGHSIVAKRATSPKIPNKAKQNGVSRASSPLAGGAGSRATSPVGSAPSNKRKAEESPVSNGSKKRKGAPPGELTDELFVQWLSNTSNATTKDCIKHFTPYLIDDAARAKLKHLVTSIAILNDKKVLVLRKNFKRDMTPKSPAPGAA